MDKTAAFHRLAEACPDWLIEPLAAYQDAEAANGAMLHSAEPVDGDLSLKISRGQNNHVFRGWRSSAKGGRVSFAGSRNIVFVGPYSRFNAADVRVVGDDNIFMFGGFSTVESMIIMLTRHWWPHFHRSALHVVSSYHYRSQRPPYDLR